MASKEYHDLGTYKAESGQIRAELSLGIHKPDSGTNRYNAVFYFELKESPVFLMTKYYESSLNGVFTRIRVSRDSIEKLLAPVVDTRKNPIDVTRCITFLERQTKHIIEGRDIVRGKNRKSKEEKEQNPDS